MFCETKNHSNHLLIPVTLGVEFLSSLYQQGRGYTTINTARSALSYHVKLLENEQADFGKHPLVGVFMRGIFKLRPALPRYRTTWDVTPVLNELKTINNDTAPLKELTMKCITLLALTTGQRSQTLAAIKINNITFNKAKTRG